VNIWQFVLPILLRNFKTAMKAGEEEADKNEKK
jgi:hypothetical protein